MNKCVAKYASAKDRQAAYRSGLKQSRIGTIEQQSPVADMNTYVVLGLRRRVIGSQVNDWAVSRYGVLHDVIRTCCLKISSKSFRASWQNSIKF